MTTADEDDVAEYCFRKGIACRFDDAPEGPVVFLTTRQPAWRRGAATICMDAHVGASTLKRVIRQYEKAGFFDDHQKYLDHAHEMIRSRYRQA